MTDVLERPAKQARRERPRRASRDKRVWAPKPPREPRPAAQGTQAVVSTTFTMLALVCLWAAFQLLVLSTISHDRAQTLLYREFRGELASATAPIGPVVPPGDPVALLRIPALGVDEVVVEGTASGDTLAGPGHKRNTVLPGQTGVSLIYGRAATYGAPFADLPELERGDQITVVTAQGEKVFAVIGVRREGDPLPPPLAEGRTRVTLVTAEGAGRWAALSPSSTVYVDAEAGDAFPAPAGRPAAVPEPEEAMARDTSAMPLLALCLALLVALTLGVIAARQRWSTALVWVVASPPALALSWATTDVVMRLLPNLM